MTDAPPPPPAPTFDCPRCQGGFEVDAAWLGKTIPCPHCGSDVLLPSGASDRPPPTASAGAPSVPAPRRRLTPAERAALRRRVNTTLAITGGALLIGLYVLLVRLS